MARFTNQAQLRYGRSIANSNIAVGEILEVLSAAKEAVRNTYRQNDTITYVISIVNAGTLAYTGLTVTDNLGAYPYNTTSLVPLDYMEGTAKYYINGVLQPAPAVTAGPPLVINGITVPAGGNAVIVYEAEVNPYAPLAATGNIVNTATITGGGITPIEVTAICSLSSSVVCAVSVSTLCFPHPVSISASTIPIIRKMPVFFFIFHTSFYIHLVSYLSVS